MRKQKVPELIEYIHSSREVRPDGTVKGTGPLIGCVVARRVRTRNFLTGRFSSGIAIGWSKVNTSAGDEFNKKTAVEIARGRAIVGSSPSIPRQVIPVYNGMVERASAYFKDVDWA